MPGVINTVQPDGTPIALTLHGDEHQAWATSPDGYTLMRDSDGYWTVAHPDSDGYAAPSAKRYAGNTAGAMANGTPRGLTPQRHAPNTIRKAPNGLQVDQSFPTKGKHKLLMLLVNFSDTEPTYTREEFQRLMNEENYGGIGSFRDFYLENSYGALDIATTVTRWINLPGGKTSYTIDNTPEIIRYALGQISAEIDLKQFDNDNDGVLDGLAIIHQGPGQEATGSSADIWSHSSTVYGMNIGGVNVGRYTIQPETLGTAEAPGKAPRMSTIGVICHEFGHNLGAPDFYDTDYAGSGGEYPGTGKWDLMGSGGWNGDRGDRPGSINMWQKIQYGWVTPTLLSEQQTIEKMMPSTFSPAAYRFDTTTPGEYFIIENRQRLGQFDVTLPREGLLVYHVNEPLLQDRIAANTINALFPQAMYTVCADAGSDPSSSPSSYGDLTAAPFSDQYGHTEFHDNTLPSTRSSNDRYAYKGLRNISIGDDGCASFDFIVYDAPAKPENLAATVAKGVVSLSWQMPHGANPDYYSVYRNNTFLGYVETCSFRDETPTDGLITYYVDAAYDSGLVSPLVSTSIRVTPNKVNKITGDYADGNSVVLNWTLDKYLSRMTDRQTDAFFIIEHKAKKAEFAHRFTADDLKVYKGCKIRRIAFKPYMPPAEASYTIKVWEADNGGENLHVVSERKVKELGGGIWNEVLLTSPVEITAEKELWVGFCMDSKTDVVQYLVETHDVTPGYGNMLNLDNGRWLPDGSVSGNYYLYAEVTDAADSQAADVDGADIPANPEIDLFFPVGFNVYRDGSLLGSTSSRCFIDNGVQNGQYHRYAVASIYKGGNESSAKIFEIGESSIDNTAANADTPIRLIDGGIVFTGLPEKATVCDLAGRVIFNDTPAPGQTLLLPAGAYILRAGAAASKFIVR